MTKSLRVGAGSAWWGDRIEPARLNAEQGNLDYLCFETMAEATISAAQVRKRRDPSFPGYDTYLDARMQAVLPACLKRGTKIVTNQGWINPDGAAERIVYWLRQLGAKGVKVASVNGSLITEGRSLWWLCSLRGDAPGTGQPAHMCWPRDDRRTWRV